MFQLRKSECTLWSTPKTKGELPSSEQISTETCRWVPLVNDYRKQIQVPTFRALAQPLLESL